MTRCPSGSGKSHQALSRDLAIWPGYADLIRLIPIKQFRKAVAFFNMVEKGEWEKHPSFRITLPRLVRAIEMSNEWKMVNEIQVETMFVPLQAMTDAFAEMKIHLRQNGGKCPHRRRMKRRYCDIYDVAQQMKELVKSQSWAAERLGIKLLWMWKLLDRFELLDYDVRERRTRLDPDSVERMYQLHLHGHGMKRISELYDVHHEVVKRWTQRRELHGRPYTHEDFPWHVVQATRRAKHAPEKLRDRIPIEKIPFPPPCFKTVAELEASLVTQPGAANAPDCGV